MEQALECANGNAMQCNGYGLNLLSYFYLLLFFAVRPREKTVIPPTLRAPRDMHCEVVEAMMRIAIRITTADYGCRVNFKGMTKAVESARWSNKRDGW